SAVSDGNCQRVSMRNFVLVHVRNGLVESDVVATVSDVLKDASIQVVTTVEAACEMLQRFDGWAWAVLDLEDDELKRDDLRQALERNRALPVVLHEPLNDPEVEDWVFLDPPFNTEMLRAALRRTAPY
ncbi:MAG: hypothetical protein AAF307_12525, partial [Pseudomonadota bacterium]